MKRRIGLVVLFMMGCLLSSCAQFVRPTYFCFRFPGTQARSLATVSNGTLKIVNSKTNEEKIINGVSGQSVTVEVNAGEIYNIFITIKGQDENSDVIYYDGCKYDVFAEAGKTNHVEINLYDTPDFIFESEYSINYISYNHDVAEADGVKNLMNFPVAAKYFEVNYLYTRGGTAYEYFCYINPDYYIVKPLPANSLGDSVPVELIDRRTGKSYSSTVNVYAKLSQLAEFKINKKSVNKIAYYTGKDTVSVEPVVKCSSIKLWEGDESQELSITNESFSYEWSGSGTVFEDGKSFEVSGITETSDVSLYVKQNIDGSDFIESEDIEYKVSYEPVSWNIRLKENGTAVKNVELLKTNTEYSIELYNELGDTSPENLSYTVGLVTGVSVNGNSLSFSKANQNATLIAQVPVITSYENLATLAIKSAAMEIDPSSLNYTSWSEMVSGVTSFFEGGMDNIECNLSSDNDEILVTENLSLTAGKTLVITGNVDEPLTVKVPGNIIAIQNSGNLTVKGINFEGNTESSKNILQIYGETNVEKCNFTNATETAVLVNSSCTISDCYFTSCSSTDGPGAIKVQNGASVVIEGCTFTDCKNFGSDDISVYGGAISAEKNITVNSCTFSGNSDGRNSSASDIYIGPGKNLSLAGYSTINSILLGYESGKYGQLNIADGFYNWNSNNEQISVQVGINIDNYTNVNDALLTGEFKEILKYLSVDKEGYKFNTNGKLTKN